MEQQSTILQKTYQARFEANARYRDAVWQILCRDFFSHYIPETSVLLDLGAGWGEFSRNIIADKKYAIDLNPECELRVAGYAQFFLQDCSTLWQLPDESLDVIFTSNFLEHLPSKAAIDATLGEAFRCLKTGGVILCLGPNIKYLPGTYWDYWDHYVPITDTSMAEALRLAGFTIQEIIPRFLPYTMSGGHNPPLFFIKLYLSLRMVWAWFGKQFFVVASKL
jgi:ubiquinone/menaquinone biosynthesis C-methylase UbiE